MKEILSEVSAYARVPMSVILSKTRKHEIVALRGLIVKVALRKGYTLQTIADFLGYKDHTSIMHLRDTFFPTDEAVDMIHNVSRWRNLIHKRALNKDYFSVNNGTSNNHSF